jgi:hypothetical protein
VRLAGNPQAAVNSHRHVPAAAQQLDAVAHKRLLNNCRRLAILARQNAMFRLDQEHLRPKLRESLSQFATNRAGADHAQAARQFGQMENRLVRQIVNRFEAR